MYLRRPLRPMTVTDDPGLALLTSIVRQVGVLLGMALRPFLSWRIKSDESDQECPEWCDHAPGRLQPRNRR